MPIYLLIYFFRLSYSIYAYLSFVYFTLIRIMTERDGLTPPLTRLPENTNNTRSLGLVQHDSRSARRTSRHRRRCRSTSIHRGISVTKNKKRKRNVYRNPRSKKRGRRSRHSISSRSTTQSVDSSPNRRSRGRSYSRVPKSTESMRRSRVDHEHRRARRSRRRRLTSTPSSIETSVYKDRIRKRMPLAAHELRNGVATPDIA